MERPKLDYSLETPEERKQFVEKLLADYPQEIFTPAFLTTLGDYIIFAMDKQERKNKKILTENRLYTINKRETSYEGLTGKLENGEDGIYSMLENNKNIILSPKDPITQKDIDSIPALKELRESIIEVEKQLMAASGRRKFLLKKQLIEMRQDQYVIRNAYRSQHGAATVNPAPVMPDFEDLIEVTSEGEIKDHSLISLFNPVHVAAILSNYSRLKQD